MKFILKRIFTVFFLLLSSAIMGQNKPNIVFILVDDMSPFPMERNQKNETRTFGFCGEKYVFTPQLDELATNGIIFTNAYVSSSVCSPSRYTTLTGRYAGRCEGDEFMRLHPIGTATRVENNTELEKHKFNVARTLQQNGYRTGFVGKSHIMEHHKLKKKHLEKNGFKTYAKDDNIKDSTVSEAMEFNHNKWVEIIKEYGFDYANAIYQGNLLELYNSDANVHNLEWITSASLEFIEESKQKEQPFFLYFSTTVPHGPEPWRKNKKGEYPYGLDADPNVTSAGYKENDYSFMPSRQDIKTEIEDNDGLRDQSAWLRWFDRSIESVINKLKSEGIYENTLIVVTSDHGSFNSGKTTLYENGVKVPLMMHYPKGINKGSKYHGLVQNIDYAPTFLELAGISVTSKMDIDGNSLVPTFKNNDVKIHDYLFFELGYARGILSEEWKYISVRYPQDVQNKINNGEQFRGFKGEMISTPYNTRNGHLGYHASSHNPFYFDKDQLFNLSEDPLETKNIYSSNKKKVKQLKELLRKQLNAFPNRPYGEFASKETQ